MTCYCFSWQEPSKNEEDRRTAREHANRASPSVTDDDSTPRTSPSPFPVDFNGDSHTLQRRDHLSVEAGGFQGRSTGCAEALRAIIRVCGSQQHWYSC